MRVLAGPRRPRAAHVQGQLAAGLPTLGLADPNACSGSFTTAQLRMLAGRYAALSGRSTRERQLGASHLSLEFADRVPGPGHQPTAVAGSSRVPCRVENAQQALGNWDPERIRASATKRLSVPKVNSRPLLEPQKNRGVWLRRGRARHEPIETTSVAPTMNLSVFPRAARE